MWLIFITPPLQRQVKSKCFWYKFWKNWKIFVKIYFFDYNCSIFKITFTYYRPQRSWGKVIFLEVCVKNSVHRGRGCMARGHAWKGACGSGGACVGGACMVGGNHDQDACMAGGACVAGGHAWCGACMAGGMCGTHAAPPSRYYEIRSMSGRYASYWNAFL